MSSSLSIPRTTTWDSLRTSRNTAALSTLKSGLSSEITEIRQKSLEVLVRRDDEGAREAVILAWDSYNDDDLECLRKESKLFVDATRRLLAEGVLAEKRLALRAVADLDLGDSMDVLLNIVVDRKHALCFQATDCLTSMCRRWGQQARMGKTLRSTRGKMLEKLYAQIVLYHEHKSQSIIDAWLCFAHWDDSGQRGLISDHRLEAYPAAMERLEKSEEPAILQLLGGYLGKTTTPSRVIEILCRRPERDLAIEIAKLAEDHSMPTLLKHLKQIPPLACLTSFDPDEDALPFDIERRIWLMIAASSDDLRQVLQGALRLSQIGTAEARKAAAEMLRHCQGNSLDTLVPALQAASLGGEAGSVGSCVAEIVQWLESPSTVLKRAAERFFKEFTLANLLEQVRKWPTQMCKAMARVVKVVETDVAETLSRQLQSPAPKKRMTALQVIQLLECADQTSEALMPLLDDPKLEVRVRVIDILSALGHEPLETLIPELLNDASTDVQDAANRAQRRYERIKKQATSS